MSLRKYDKEWLEELCKDSYSFAEVLRKAGRKPGGGSQQILKNKIKEFNIDISHFTGKLWNKGKVVGDHPSIKGKTDEEIFIKDSDLNRQSLRRRVLAHNLLEYKCQKCGCDGNWQNGIISLEIHHIDGNNKNNILENLQFLCPNCHALTESYRKAYRY